MHVLVDQLDLIFSSYCLCRTVQNLFCCYHERRRLKTIKIMMSSSYIVSEAAGALLRWRWLGAMVTPPSLRARTLTLIGIARRCQHPSMYPTCYLSLALHSFHTYESIRVLLFVRSARRVTRLSAWIRKHRHHLHHLLPTQR